MQRLEQFFAIPGLVDFRINALCDKPSKEANKKFPLEVSMELSNELGD